LNETTKCGTDGMLWDYIFPRKYDLEFQAKVYFI